MLYAKVVLGLPIDGPFDYIVPPAMGNKVRAGARVWVNFRNKREVAYVVGLSAKTRIKRLKEISSPIDCEPLLDERMLLLTRKLAEHYCCSWGEAIETALPDELRKGRPIKEEKSSAAQKCAVPAREPGRKIIFLSGFDRMPVYLREIRLALAAKRSAILLFPDIKAAQAAKEAIEEGLGVEVFLSFRKQPKESQVWQRARDAKYCVVAGTRSAIFSPVRNLGLIIVDREDDQVYKQEQVPHYRAGQVAIIRGEIERARVVLASHCSSLESFFLAQKNKLEYEDNLPKQALPEIKVVDPYQIPYAQRKTASVFSKFLTDAMATELAKKGKILILINRKGFATSASCHNCGSVLKCPACNINLVYHFEEEKLKCHHCNFKMELPGICPSCNAGYIKYSGMGTEKIESELARIFPQAAIKILEEGKEAAQLSQADILVATGSVIKRQDLRFDLIGVLAIDNLLNRVDFRASEKAFALLSGLLNLTSGRIIIQSANSGHYCLRALLGNDPRIFLAEELKQRKLLGLPPYKHMLLVKLRGKVQDKVKKAASELFENLTKPGDSAAKVISLNCGQPPKLRGNFYYQILLSAPRLKPACRSLKLRLKECNFSGIIVTVDVDPF